MRNRPSARWETNLRQEKNMSLGILTNVSGLAAQRSLTEANRMMETSMERLTTGSALTKLATMPRGLRLPCEWTLKSK